MENKQILAIDVGDERRIIYEYMSDTERDVSYEILMTPELDRFMLKTPEPVKDKIKFGIFRIGKIKSNLGRKDIYEDR